MLGGRVMLRETEILAFKRVKRSLKHLVDTLDAELRKQEEILVINKHHTLE